MVGSYACKTMGILLVGEDYTLGLTVQELPQYAAAAAPPAPVRVPLPSTSHPDLAKMRVTPVWGGELCT